MNQSIETTSILTIVFVAGTVFGYSIDYLDRLKRLRVDNLIIECEKQLPRDQHCKIIRAVPRNL